MSVLYLELDRPLRALTTLDKMADEYDEAEIPEGILMNQSAALQRMDRHAEAVDRLKIGFDRGEYSEQLAMAYVSALMQKGDLTQANQAVRLAAQRFPQATGLADLNSRLGQQLQTRMAENREETVR